MVLAPPPTLVPAGSYYLTTTYGALEHIKNYDKIRVTRQLSVEVQDSIHRWERRRMLNKARASRSSVQVVLGAILGGNWDCGQIPPLCCMRARWGLRTPEFESLESIETAGCRPACL